MENPNPNIQLWQNHKPKAACVVVGGTREPCKWPVLPSQPLIKSLSFEHITNLIFAGAVLVIPKYNTPWTEKSTLGGKNLPVLTVSSYHVETSS